MSVASINCAVVGVGYLGRFHAQKYLQAPNANLVGVFDLSGDRAKTVADELKVPIFNTLEEVDKQAAAVSIVSATQSHFEVAKFFLSKGIHCLVEKPITVTAHEANELVEIAASTGSVLQVGHIERFNPAWKASEKILDTFEYAQFHRLAPYKPRGVDANVVFDLMIHDIELLLSAADRADHGPIINLTAQGSKVVSAEVDYAQARFTFKSGATADLFASRISPESDRRARFFSAKRTLSVDMGAMQLQIGTIDPSFAKPEDRLKLETVVLEKQDALLAEVIDFSSSILEKRSPLVPGIQGARAVEIAERVIRAIRA